jgi:hypothetical protein
MWITHSYLGTTRDGTRCLFFLLFEDYIEAQAGFSKELNLEIERFARNMGNFGAVVAPFAGDVPETRKSIVDKEWSEEEKVLLRNTPAMLMIDRDFDDFNPRAHPWVLFHFGRDVQDAAKFRSLLQKVSDAVATEGSDPFEIVRNALRNAAIAAASQSVQLKPGVFGVSIDLRAAWSTLKDYLRSQKSHS